MYQIGVLHTECELGDRLIVYVGVTLVEAIDNGSIFGLDNMIVPIDKL